MQPSSTFMARVQSLVAAALPDTVEILTPATSPQPAGGRREDWDTATVSTVAGLVLPDTRPGERAEGGRQVSELRWIVRLPYGTVVTPKQRLRVNGTTYQVLSVTAGQSFAAAVDCQCRTL
jgi:hypothetical protein